MRFTLDPGGDVVVPDGVTLGQCRDGLARLAGRPDLRDAPLRSGGTVLPDDHVAGAPPWVAGSVLRWAGDGTSARPAGRLRPDPAVVAARADWHVAVVAGTGTGEVHAPDPGDAVVDLGSVAAPGTVVRHRPGGRVRARRWWVEGRTGGRRPLRPGDRVRLGPSTVELRVVTAVPGPGGRRRRRGGAPGGGLPAPRRDGDGLAGHLRELRGTVLQPAVVVPLGGSLVLAAVLRSPVLLLLGLVGPLTMLLQRREPAGPGTRAPGAAGYDPHADRGGAGAPADEPPDALRVRPPRPGRRLTDPAAAALRAALTGPPAPDGPRAGGCGAATPSGAVARTATGAAAGPPGARWTVERTPWWSFAADGGLAVVGPPSRAAGVLRALLADALADPTLPLAVLPPADPSWSWLRWAGRRLAGASGSRVGRTLAQAEQVLAGCSGRVLVVDADGRARRPALHRWWTGRRSPDAGLLLLEDQAADLPAWCPWVLDLHAPDGDEVGERAPAVAPHVDGHGGGSSGGHGGPAVLRGPDGSAVPVEVAGVTAAWAERHARRCAASRGYPGPTDALVGPEAGPRPDVPDRLPRRVSLGDLGLAVDRAGITQAWTSARRRRRLDLALGADERGAVVVDLVREGPHLLVAGTTGAGKSELLQTLLLTLAVTRPPTEVAMVLVDYKGGAGFGRTRDLPHVAGMVTDLDPATAARALEGLRTELRRREELLAAADVTDVADLPRPPARLVVVVDEFRALVEDLPEFVPALVRLATQGRSLGIHLVLATQRPAGVVDAQLRANLPLRICLRVTDPADSRDVVDVPDAAGISATTPGRAVLARPGSGTAVLQTAWAALPGGPPHGWSADASACPPAGGSAGTPNDGPTDEPAARLGVVTPVRPGDPWTTWCPWRHPDVPVSGPVHGDPSPHVVDALVAEVRAAHLTSGDRAPDAPWLAPLPDRVTAADLAGLDGLAGPAGLAGLAGLPSRDGLPTVGPHEHGATGADTREADSGEEDRRDAPDGAPTSSRHALAVRDLPEHRRRDVVTWDRAGHLAVVGGPGSGRTTTLRTVAAAALADGAAVHVLTAGSEAPWHALAPHPGLGTVVGPDDPARALTLVRALLGRGRSGSPALLCVDDAAGVVRALDLLPRAPGTDLLDRVLREARANRVAVALSTLPAEAHRLLQHVTERVVLRVDDLHDALALGVPRTLWSAATPPGRGVHLPAPGAGGPRLCQVLLPAAGPPARSDGPLPRPQRLARLPASVGLDEIPVSAAGGRVPPGRPVVLRSSSSGSSSRGSVPAPAPVLGLGGDHAEPVLLPLDPAVLVVGPPSTGRTTTLRTIGVALRQAGHDVRDDPADVLAAVTGAVPTAPGSVVLVDDVEVLLRRRTHAEDLLTTWVDGAEEGRPDVPRLVVTARTDRVAAAYRGLLATLRTTATLVVLAPGSPGSAEVAGTDLTTTLDPLDPLRPGRGALVLAGRATRVQVAVP